MVCVTVAGSTSMITLSNHKVRDCIRTPLPNICRKVRHRAALLPAMKEQTRSRTIKGGISPVADARVRRPSPQKAALKHFSGLLKPTHAMRVL
jgi:hypothetical protein